MSNKSVLKAYAAIRISYSASPAAREVVGDGDILNGWRAMSKVQATTLF
jgi:hypothetical protein